MLEGQAITNNKTRVLINDDNDEDEALDRRNQNRNIQSESQERSCSMAFNGNSYSKLQFVFLCWDKDMMLS